MDDDDDVEIVQQVDPPVEIICEICRISLTKDSVSQRQAHYEEHFSYASQDQPQSESPKVIGISSSVDTSRQEGQSPNTSKHSENRTAEIGPQPLIRKQNVFWHHSQATPPPSNFTPGLIPLLKQALLKSHAKGQTVRAALCYEGMVHVGTERWDLGWGCGYRNFLMACTALMDQQVQPLYFPALDYPSPPGVRNLQQWIEDAWKGGYDPEGAADLKNKLVGTKKWIGTAELYVAFLSRSIPSRLVDFPHVESNADAVLRWIVTYFSEPSHDARDMRHCAKVKTTVDEALRGASPVVVTDRMPLILQHKGHSRTIVGYERTKDGSTNLLCFDPSRRPKAWARAAAIARLAAKASQTAPVQPQEDNHHNFHGISTSKIVNAVFHPRKHKEKEKKSILANTKKRRSEEDIGRSLKRVRGGLHVSDGSKGKNKEVIEISDDEVFEVEQVPRPSNSAPKATLRDTEYASMLEFFRLRPKKVGLKDRYQILYFPLGDLLTDQERWARRIVTSEVVK